MPPSELMFMWPLPTGHARDDLEALEAVGDVDAALDELLGDVGDEARHRADVPLELARPRTRMSSTMKSPSSRHCSARDAAVVLALAAAGGDEVAEVDEAAVEVLGLGDEVVDVRPGVLG